MAEPAATSAPITAAVLPALTGLRFLAALLVLLGHCAESFVRFSGPEPLWRYYLCKLPAIGMPLFFVLSGFVIHYNYREAIGAAPLRGTINFFVARFARLYPMYFLVLCLDLFRFGYFENLDTPAMANTLYSAIPQYLTLMQSWEYRLIDGHSLIFVFPAMTQITWSISTEWFFYLLYPFACFALAKLRRPVSIKIAIAGIILVGYAGVLWSAAKFDAMNAYAAVAFGGAAGIATSPDSLVFWLFYFSPYPRLLEFGLGCLVAALFAALRTRPVSPREACFGQAAIAVAIVMLIILTALLFPGSDSVPSGFLILRMCFGFAPVIAILLFCCVRYSTWLSTTLSRAWIVLCGEASYSIYLLHIGIVQYVQLFDQFSGAAAPAYDIWSTLHALLAVILVTMTVIGLSLVTFNVVEVPARRVLRRLLTLRPPSAIAATRHAVVEPRAISD